MAATDIPVGLRGSVRRRVTEEMCASRMGVPGADVLASPILGMLFEQAALDALEQFGGPELRTLGIRLELDHAAATPLGFEVAVEATLVEVDGRRLRFDVEARDSVEPIGKGLHERVVVDWGRFLSSVEAKRGAQQ
jgi:fluoroacetyl-CoA thioesterase